MDSSSTSLKVSELSQQVEVWSLQYLTLMYQSQNIMPLPQPQYHTLLNLPLVAYAAESTSISLRFRIFPQAPTLLNICPQ